MVNLLTNQPPELKIFQNFVVKYEFYVFFACLVCFFSTGLKNIVMLLILNLLVGVSKHKRVTCKKSLYMEFYDDKKFLEKVEMKYNYNKLLQKPNIFI